MRIAEPLPNVSIYNFHYAEPSAVGDNYHHGIVLADDETGFKGQSARPYRQEAWEFMLSGGAILSNLDFAYTAEKPDGTASIELESPSYGGPVLQKQLSALKKFIESFDFAGMEPHNEVVHRNHGPQRTFVLAEPGRSYALYMTGGEPLTQLQLTLPMGTYMAEWISPEDGHTQRSVAHDHPGGLWTLETPLYADDIALRIQRR
jgi:hypothetical protein